jgi:hypothetical protein
MEGKGVGKGKREFGEGSNLEIGSKAHFSW